MANYEIIKNENLLREFIQWLPELKKDETFYCALLARKKYCSDVKQIKSDKAQLKRFTSNKVRLFQKIKQLECELGCYQQNEIDIPQEALALYINPNPRSIKKATVNSVKRLLDLVTSNNIGYNPNQEVLSEIQKACGSKVYVDIDIDTTEECLTRNDFHNKYFYSQINRNAYHVLRTRGGYHALVELSKIDSFYDKCWYNNILALKSVDIVGDNLIPIPGCTQGNFVPYFLK